MTQQQYFDAFTTITEKMIQLTKVKNTDYAESDDAFANFKVIEVLSHGRITTADGIWVRMTDKIKRISSLLSREAVGKDEKLTDTVFDLAVYSVILMIWLQHIEQEIFMTKVEAHTKDKGYCNICKGVCHESELWKATIQKELNMRHTPRYTHTLEGNACVLCNGPCEVLF